LKFIKENIKMKASQKSILIAMLVALVAGAALFALPAGTAAAQSPTPAAPQSPAPQTSVDKAAQRIARLEKAFQVENNTLARQATWLDKAGNVVTRIQTLIDKLKVKGIVPSRLEAALTTFEAKLADAKAFHATAAGILSTHTGFDASGKVTDLAQAQATVKSAHEALSDVRTTISGTIKNIQQVVKDLRGSLKPTSQNP
jgi:uncharacterized phage infection (PIP) family protein YhgE